MKAAASVRALAAAAFLGMAGPRAAGENTASIPTAGSSNITLRVSTPVDLLPRFGFVPVRVSVSNRSARDGTWQFRFLAGSPAAPTGAISSRLEVSAAAGEDREEWFFVPLADTAPGFTLASAARGGRMGVPARPVTMATVEESPTVAGVETRARARFLGGFPFAPPAAAWTGRIEPGNRPGAKTGVATATVSVGSGETPLTGAVLPLGVDVADGNTENFNRVRRFIYKESMPDPAAGAAPKASAWSSLSSSITAEAAARRALEPTGLLQLPAGVVQSVHVTPLASGNPGDPVAWLTSFVQSGSARLLPLGPVDVPPGAVVNLHASSRPGEVVRTVTFVEPSALPGFELEAGAEGARALLLRYGFLLPVPGVEVGRAFPGRPEFSGAPQHAGAVHWFESGPPHLLAAPLFGALPPNTSAYMVPGDRPGAVVRVFAVGRPPRISVPSVAAGAGPAAQSGLRMTITGPGIVGAASAMFPGLLPATAGHALPVAASARIAAPVRQTLKNGELPGLPNVTPIAVDALPADWRIWSPYHLVVLRAAEYDGFDEPRRQALHSWVMQGGHLFIEPVANDNSGFGPLQPRVPLEVSRLGLGRITRLPFTLEDYVSSEDQNLDASLWIKPAMPADFIALGAFHTPALTLPIGEFLHPPALPAAAVPGDSASHGKWAAGILAAFALIAGPVNLFVFAPAGRRHRLFLTMPLLAFLFAGGLAAAMVAWDGTGGAGSRAAVVVTVPEAGSAIVFQDQVARTGMLGSRRFGIPDRVLVANLPVDDFDSTGRDAVLDRGGDTAGGDWFRSHWAAAQHLRDAVPMRGGLVFRAGGAGAPVVESSFPVTLRGFVYLDASNRSWFADEVPPGRPVMLRSGAGIRGWPPFAPAGSAYLERVFSVAARLEPGRWIARGDSSGIAPISTLGSVRWEDDVIYTGLAGPGEPAELPQLTPQPPIVSEG